MFGMLGVANVPRPQKNGNIAGTLGTLRNTGYSNLGDPTEVPTLTKPLRG